jgi:seryl-tRNA synthetase
MGSPDMRQIDIEAWMPGQNRYRETNTSDLMGDYQAHRLQIRVKRISGETEFVHMNDATACAGRALIAIMENYQEEDGSIAIPAILQGYIGRDKITKVDAT